MTQRIRVLIAASLLLSGAFQAAQAQQSSTSSAPAAAPVATTSISAATATGDLEEVVVNGIRRGDLIMPTTVTSESAYGLDLGVMDTPRNNTVLSNVQIDALNVQNPGGFSALTSSACN